MRPCLPTRWVAWLAIPSAFTLLLLIDSPSHTAWGQCTVTEEQKLTASDGAADEYFGISVSVSGNVAIVGKNGDDGVDTDSGSAYVYRFDGNAWVEEQTLFASDGSRFHSFGYAVAVNGDVAVVGAIGDDDRGINSGAAYVFRWNGNAWIEEQKLTASDGRANRAFGISVAVNGNVVVVGMYRGDGAEVRSGTAYVFRFDGDSWIEEEKLFASDGAEFDSFGKSVSVNGDRALVGARGDDDAGCDTGSAYVFRFDGGTWIEEQKLTAKTRAAHDFFGTSVSLDGNVAFVGAQGHDTLEPGSGSVFVFSFDGSEWIELQELLASDGTAFALFGYSVSVSGDIALVGARGQYDDSRFGYIGAAYLFRLSGNRWLEARRFVASDDLRDVHFGYSVSVSGNAALVGAERNPDRGSRSGAVYLFDSGAPVCQLGTVDLANRATPAKLLTINGESGECPSPTVIVPIGAPVEVFLDAPPSGPTEAPFAVYAWLGEPDPSTRVPQPLGLGTMCFPTFLSAGLPKPLKVWNNAGHHPLLGKPDFPSEPAPSVVVSRVNGWHEPIIATVQGFIVDDGSAAAVPGSVTNAVILKVVE